MIALLFPEERRKKKISSSSDSVNQNPMGKTEFRDHKF